MDKKQFLDLIDNMNIDKVNDFRLEVELEDGTKIIIKNDD